VHLSENACWPIDTAYYAEPAADQNLRYLYHLLTAVDLVRLEKSTALPGLSRDDYNSVRVPQRTLQEQAIVVGMVDSYLAKIAKLQEMLLTVGIETNRLETAVLRDAFSGALTRSTARTSTLASNAAQGLVAEIQAKNEMKSAIVQEILDDELPASWPSIPDHWAWARLGAVLSVTGGKALSGKRSLKGVRNVPYLRVANVQRGHLDLTDVKTMAVTDDELARFRLADGDVLLNEGGDRDKVGRGWVWEGQLDDCIHQNHVFRGRVRDGRISARVISRWTNSYGQQYFARHARQTTNLASINLGRLSLTPVPVPPPSEQIELEERLESAFASINGLRAAHLRALTLLAALRRATMQTLLRGNHYEHGRAEGGSTMAKKTALDQLPAPRQSNAEDSRKHLLVVLGEHSGEMEGEQLFIAASYSGDQLDQFYLDLLSLADQVDILVPRQPKNEWPTQDRFRVRLRSPV
jgi:type I restriction enzyme S subunit